MKFHGISFKKLFALFTLGTAVLFLLNSLLLVYLSNRNIEAALLDLQNQKGEQIRTVLDEEIYSRINNIVFDYLVEPDILSVRNFFLYDDWEEEQFKIERTLDQAVLINDWLKSIVLYREDNVLVTDHWSRSNLKGDVVTHTLEGVQRYIESQEQGAGWFSWKSPAFEGDIISYYQKFPVIDPARNRGFILLSMDSVSMKNVLVPLLEPAGFGIVLLDQELNPLFRYPENNTPEWLFGTYSENTEDSFLWKHKGAPYLVRWSRAYSDGLIIGLFLDSGELNRQLQLTQKSFYIFAVLFLLVCILIFFLFSESFSQPVSSIIRNLSTKTGGGDLSLPGLADGIDRLIDENRDLIIQHFCLDLLAGNLPSDSERKDIGRLLGMEDINTPLYVLIGEIDPRSITGIQEKEILFQDIQNKWRSVLSGDTLLILRYPVNSLTGLYFPGVQVKTAERAFNDDIRLQGVNTACSPLISDLGDIPSRFRRVRKNLERRFYTGYGNLFLPEADEASLRETPLDSEEFRVLLLRGGYSEFLDGIRALFSGGNESRFPRYMILDFFIRIIQYLSEAAQKKGADCDELTYPVLREELEQLAGLEELNDWLKGKTGLLEKQTARSQEREHRSLFLDVKEYIDTHLNAEISQTAAAEYFGVSTGFLSRLFRDFTPGGFNDYLKQAKLEDAAGRIREKRMTSIAGLAADLGYSTPAYFTRLFKARFGVTPQEYLKKNGDQII